MKLISILKQYRLSTSWDEGKAPSELRLRAQSQEARQFVADLTRLEQGLRAEPPLVRAPDSLHGAIMARVRECERVSYGGRRPSLFHYWWAAPVGASVLAACLLTGAHLWRQPADEPSPPSVQRELAALPAQVLSPLSDELENLHRDAKNTAEFLLASVPEVSN